MNGGSTSESIGPGSGIGGSGQNSERRDGSMTTQALPSGRDRIEHQLEQWEDADEVVSELWGPTSGLVSREVRPWLSGDWLGHALHPLLTDVTIGCWTSAFVLDVVGGRAARRNARMLIGLGLLSVP